MSTLTPPPFDQTQPLHPGVTLLEASAGTGKTYSISSLVLRFVLEYRMPIDQLLIVTFTNAATAELSARIRLRLGEAMVMLRDGLNRSPDEDPDNLDPLFAHLLRLTRTKISLGVEGQTEGIDWLRQAIEDFDRAHISTIHSFCQRMLQQHALDAKAPFGVKLLERTQDIIDNLVQDYWAHLLAKQSPIEIQLLKLKDFKPKVFRQLAKLAIEQRHARIVPERPATAYVSSDRLLGELTQFGKFASAQAIEDSMDAIMHVTALQKYAPKLQLAFEKLAEGRDLKSALATLVPLTYKYAQAAQTPLIDQARRLYQTFQEWNNSSDDWALAIRHDFVTHIRERYAEYCTKANVWDFNDLLLRLEQAVWEKDANEDYPLAEKISASFKAILIDEFQDTDATQWAIFSKLFKRKDKFLFLIGDPKQAIYAFRGADINTYLEAANHADQRYTLTTNYRSDDPLIEVINTLYRPARPPIAALSRDNPAMVPLDQQEALDPNDSIFGKPQIQYIQIKAKKAQRLHDSGPPLRLMWVKRRPANSQPDPKQKEVTLLRPDWLDKHLPHLVAEDIVQKLQSDATIQDEYGESRRLTPSDMAVLVRTNQQAEWQQEALRARGVPAVIYGSRSIYETIEAQELSEVLQAILEPSKARLVHKALITRLLGVTAQQIAEFSLSGGEMLEDWINRLYGWRTTWLKLGFIQAFRELLNSRSEALLTQQGGERRVANFIQLSELLHLQATERGLKAPALAEWLRRQVKRAQEGQETALESEERLQVRLETDEPAVEIVTIHKAKGLEYPLVWVPSLFYGNSFSQKNPFAFRDDEGAALELRTGSSNNPVLTDAEPHSRESHLGFAERDQRLETMRLLYVALTRAKHQITLYGGITQNLFRGPLNYLLHLAQQPYLGDIKALEEIKLFFMKELSSIPDESYVKSFNDGWPELAARATFVPALAPVAKRSQYIPPERPQDVLVAASWPPRMLDTEWRRTSFSGLASEIHGADTSYREPEQDQSAADEDAIELPSLEALPLLPAPEEAPVRLAELPAGRMVGNFIHKVFELHDFQNLDYKAISALIETELKHFGLDTALTEPFSLAFQEILQTPLNSDGFRLCDLPAKRRLAELDFVFPIRERGFNHAELFRVFQDYGSSELHQWLEHHYGGGRGFTVRGFLSGSIDLVFQNPKDGRWYLLDWKSNRLGTKPSQYNRASMAAVMGHHHYYLQYHLYAVALLRYLKARLGPAFDYERDFGGVYYLFLRGIHPAHPPGTGIFYDRPPARLLQELDRCLAAQAPTSEGTL